MGHENLNTEETANSDLGAFSGSALPDGWLDWNTLLLDQMVNIYEISICLVVVEMQNVFSI